jgi:hypothetical protein
MAHHASDTVTSAYITCCIFWHRVWGCCQRCLGFMLILVLLWVRCVEAVTGRPCCGIELPTVYISLAFWKKNINPLTPNDHYTGRTAPLTSKRCILYIYSTNIGTEYFKHAIYPPFFSLQNPVCFIILTYLVPVLFTFYIQGVLKLKKIIPAPKV